MNIVPMLMNAEYAIRGIHGEIHEDELESNVTDLLTDLMHLCENRGFDFLNCLELAKRHYIEEKTDE